MRTRSVVAGMAVVTVAVMVSGCTLAGRVPPRRAVTVRTQSQTVTWAQAQLDVDYPIRQPSWLPNGLALRGINVDAPPRDEANPAQLTKVRLFYSAPSTHATLEITTTALTVQEAVPNLQHGVIGGAFVTYATVRSANGKGQQIVLVDIRTHGVTYILTGTGLSLDDLKRIAGSIVKSY